MLSHSQTEKILKKADQAITQFALAYGWLSRPQKTLENRNEAVLAFCKGFFNMSEKTNLPKKVFIKIFTELHAVMFPNFSLDLQTYSVPTLIKNGEDFEEQDDVFAAIDSYTKAVQLDFHLYKNGKVKELQSKPYRRLYLLNDYLGKDVSKEVIDVFVHQYPKLVLDPHIIPLVNEYLGPKPHTIIGYHSFAMWMAVQAFQQKWDDVSVYLEANMQTKFENPMEYEKMIFNCFALLTWFSNNEEREKVIKFSEFGIKIHSNYIEQMSNSKLDSAFKTNHKKLSPLHRFTLDRFLEGDKPLRLNFEAILAGNKKKEEELNSLKTMANDLKQICLDRKKINKKPPAPNKNNQFALKPPRKSKAATSSVSVVKLPSEPHLSGLERKELVEKDKLEKQEALRTAKIKQQARVEEAKNRLKLRMKNLKQKKKAELVVKPAVVACVSPSVKNLDSKVVVSAPKMSVCKQKPAAPKSLVSPIWGLPVPPTQITGKLVEFAQQVIIWEEKTKKNIYIVGGASLDLLDNDEESVDDLDLVTDATLEELAPYVKQQGLLIFDDPSLKIENMKFSKLIKPLDTACGLFNVYTRNQQIAKICHRQNVSLHEEADARDFRVNTIYTKFVQLPNKQILAFFFNTKNGFLDFTNRVLRFVGDAQTSMLADPIRMFRLVYLSVKRNFNYDASYNKIILNMKNKKELFAKVNPNLLQMWAKKIYKNPGSLEIAKLLGLIDALPDAIKLEQERIQINLQKRLEYTK